MNKSPKGRWDGLRAIVVARQSKDENGTGSNAAQLDYMAHEFERVGLTCVDTEVLDGVPASAPKRITEILERLFARKRERDDYDVIAWQLEDRASRGGGKHGMWLEHEANRHGLLIYFAGDEAEPRPYDAMIRVAKYEAAKETSVGIGRRSRQGQSLSKKTGFFRTSGPTSFGCYRLYLNENDEPKYFIRNLPDGTQEQVDWKTREVIGRYGTVGKKSRHRFKKQRNEYSLLMPGDREHVRVVVVIFYLRFKRGWRGVRIADFLNRNGICSPQGKEWSQRQVQIIYEHEAYTGVTFNDRTFSGRYFKYDPVLGYVPLDRSEIELVAHKTFTPKLNPQDEWSRIDQPYMYEFLPRTLRDLAIADQAATWAARADPTRPRRKPNAHPASNYLFSGLLRAKQDEAELKGTRSGREGEHVLYYRHPKWRRGRRKGSVFNGLVRADVLHVEAVRVLSDLLLTAPDLRERLTTLVTEQRAAASTEAPDVAALKAEAEDIGVTIREVMKMLKGAALAEARAELDRLGTRRNAIEAQLKRVLTAAAADARPIEQVVDHAIAVLRDDAERLLTLPPALLREAIRRYVTAATVDMATKAVELTIALPVWALADRPERGEVKAELRKTPRKKLCVPQSSRSPALWWTQHKRLTWMTFECTYDAVRGSTTRPPCYACRRVRRAA